ncbi:hypothetical protein DWV13_01420 [Clostridium botulinum]|uniref:manganese efflux pump n=1 Tax=Clostridium TaxID=1485 RepID=UPI0013F8DD68|nr:MULTISPECIES: manganese efflux pump [Clostridium]MCS6130324.1 hypothetical protein [Clostridium botulinum]NFL45451.1 hypothetical protein [Clostridium botulinum]NFL90557.1 hypothetical protein [Clostridium botulinum]
MNIFSPLLLSLSSHLDTFRVSNFCSLKKMSIEKAQILLISIITTFTTFISMCIGELISKLLLKEIVVPFGCILLIFIGTYFFVEHVRLKKKSRNEDTSYYVEDNSKFGLLLKEGNLSLFTHSNYINFKDTLSLSIFLSKTNILLGLIAGLLNISIPLSIFFNFIINILMILIGSFITKFSFSNWLLKNFYILSGILLILWGLCEYLI